MKIIVEMNCSTGVGFVGVQHLHNKIAIFSAPATVYLLLIALQFPAVVFLYLTKKSYFPMTAYPGQNRMTLGQLYAALWQSQSRSDVI